MRVPVVAGTVLVMVFSRLLPWPEYHIMSPWGGSPKVVSTTLSGRFTTMAWTPLVIAASLSDRRTCPSSPASTVL